MARTKITVLCDNSIFGTMGLMAEHGFSALVEKDGQRILFDTGQGLALANNARTLDIDLASISTLVLSHGHYDHTGGLPAVLSPPRGVQTIAHPDIFAVKYAETKTPSGLEKTFIGMKYSRNYLEDALQAKFEFVREFTEIAPGIFFSGEITRKTEFEYPDPRLKVKTDGQLQPDPLLDDASLLIQTEKGPVVLFGCAHAGAVNVLEHLADQTGLEKFHAVIGGTHLMRLVNGFEKQLQTVMQAFDQYSLNMVAVSHCTGQQASALCYQHFKDRIAFASTGWSIVF